ncbi:hypothetical protein ACF0H5_001870 [Mactra antiquata]
MDVSSIRNIPGYVEILRFVLKTQIQNLVEQLRDHGGEETLVLSANLTAGTISHLGSDKGQGFLEARDDIRSHFLTHCLQGNQNYHTAHQPGNPSHHIALKNLQGISRRDTSLNTPQPGNKTNSSPCKQLDICAGHGPEVKHMNLPTIDQATVRDMIRLPMDTHISRITELGHHNTHNDVNLSIPQSSKMLSKSDTIHSLTTSQQVHTANSSITKHTAKSIFSPILPDSRISLSSEAASVGVKLLCDSNLLHTSGDPFTRIMPEVPLPIHTGSVIREPITMATKSTEQVTKTKRKPKRRSEIQAKPDPLEFMGKKAKVYESLLNPNSLVTIVPPTACNDITASQVVKVTASSISDNGRNSTSSDSNVGSTGISLLNMQQVLLLNDTNIGDIQSQNVYIESPISGHPMKRAVTETHRSSTLEPTGMTSLISGNKFTSDTREKDKTKKTLSSKIDEITQRITKDDAIKQHTVHTKITEFSLSPPCPPVYSNSSASEGGVNDSAILNTVSTGDHTEDSGSLTTIDVSSPDNCTGSSIEHLGDSEGKCKDGSRASHRKPKLPRYNIGVASDDDDNGDSSQCSSPQTPALINTMVTTPSSVNINHDDTQDIINIQVSNDDSETSFPHINLEELADGLLLTDIPIVSYYNSVEESSKSVIESVFNLKPGRDPSTKKPLNSQSIIVSGSKSEKDWVKCPMCPDKFLTVEALQFHITNVNHAAKKYQCDLCGRKFGQLRDMERHRRIHTGERPFQCDICQKSFSRKDNLKSHRKKHSLIL